MFLPVILMEFLLMVTCSRVKRESGPRGVVMSPSDMNAIVAKHNTLRASSSSSNMRRMSWDTELSMIAQEYGLRCRFSHNTEGNHSKFKTSIGENIYVASGSYENFDAGRAIQLWFDEINYFNYNTRTCQPGKMCGHYTQVVWASTYKVGCSLTMCDHVTGFSVPNSHLFICNYSPAGNVYSAQGLQTPFLKGTPCTKCSNSSDSCIDDLCSNSYRDKEVLFESAHVQETSCSGLIAAVVLLSLALFALLFYTIYQKREEWLSKCTDARNNTTQSKFSSSHRSSSLHGAAPAGDVVRKNLMTTTTTQNKFGKSPNQIRQPQENSPNPPQRPPPPSTNF